MDEKKKIEKLLLLLDDDDDDDVVLCGRNQGKGEKILRDYFVSVESLE